MPSNWLAVIRPANTGYQKSGSSQRRRGTKHYTEKKPMASKKNKPRIYHSIKTGVNEKGEFGKEVKLIIKTADSVFNSPSKTKRANNNRK